MSCDYYSLVPAGVRSLHPYQPGKPIEELGRELGLVDIIKLASNENPGGPSESVLQAIAGSLLELSRYPDGNGFALKSAFQRKLKIGADQITLGNGSNDVLDLLARVFAGPGKEVVFSEFAFAVYPIVSLAANATPVVAPSQNWGHDLDSIAAAINEKTALIFLANPNNPTGTYFTKSAFESFMVRVPEQVVVVLDEAYYEYVDKEDYPNGLDYLDTFPNLIVVRTFSKAYGLAGLRIGYSLSHPQIANLLNRVRQPFNANSLALKAAEVALGDEKYLEKSVALNRKGLKEFENELEKLGVNYIPSVANFLTVDFGEDAAHIDKLLLQKGVIVRPLKNYKMPTCLRVSVGLKEENERFLAALKECL